ncbi:DsbA family protein [Pengzhenrongella sicca]|uniref:Thioredoxin domain-containing protein n=1 Tax=Pengzhenrongella sicca TaxID=2819238 RepID=A0A8A4ZC82_9MICO|nr:thioredoxin domain-containing protein [Pengzhenrongella sicca]QTE29474.1 thioredoxin domain-containing protein [Pengzhenrongella sicca]
MPRSAPSPGPQQPGEHGYGDPAAPVTIVEFGDFECPYCRKAAPVLRELVDGADGAVRLVWRHFPLFEVHPHALTAALAAEAAAAAGQFWPMHDRLFAHQNRLTDDDLRRHAEALGLDPESAAGEGAQAFADGVAADYTAGLALGVAGTPTLLIDGERYTGTVQLEALRVVVAEQLSAVDGRTPRQWREGGR